MKARQTNNGKKGGLLKGKSHEKGGIKVVVTDTNQMVEVEGGEAIITKPAVQKNWKLLSKINQEAGGNPILPPSKAINNSELKSGGNITKEVSVTGFNLPQILADAIKSAKRVTSDWSGTEAVQINIPTTLPKGVEPTSAYRDAKKDLSKKITEPIEVVYNPQFKEWNLVDGNHRLAQALANNQKTILANVSIVNEDLDGNQTNVLELLKQGKTSEVTFAGGGKITSKDEDDFVELKYILDGKEVGHLNYAYDKKNAFSTGFDNSELYIDIIHVNKNHRNKGIAKELLKKAISDAESLGVEVITLKRDSGGCNYGSSYDTFLKKLYTGLGFVETWTEKDFEQSGGEKNRCAMHLYLSKQMAKGGALEQHKEVSSSVQASIKDILEIPKYSDLKPMEAGMMYSLLSDYKDFESNEEGMPSAVIYLSQMQQPIFESLIKKEYLIDDSPQHWGTKYALSLTEQATKFIDAVTTRLQTRRAVKQGTDLFPDESAIPELVSVEYPEEAESNSKSGKPVKYSAKEISTIASVDLMKNFAQLKPEFKDLMDEAIVVTEKLNKISEKGGNNVFDYEYHSDKPNASRKLFPFVHRMYMQFITSRKSTPEKKEKDIALFTKTIENAKEYLKNPPSDEELAILKQAKEEKDTDKTEKTKQHLASEKLRYERISELIQTEKEFIESIGGNPRQIAVLLEKGESKNNLLLTKKITQAFEEVDGASDFSKVLSFMEKHDFNINALISKLTSVNYDDKEKRQKSIDLILKLEKIASGDADAVEQKKFSENYRPLLWHLTLKEFCEYAENYEVDTRLEGTKARLECEEFYKYAVVKPLLDDSAERNVFLLAVESGQLPYEKAVEIIKSAGAWDESNRFVKELEENNRRRIYYANIWHTPKELYLSSDYYKNNFTKAKADKHYAKQIHELAFLNDIKVHDLLEQGIISFKDIQARISESGLNIPESQKWKLDRLKQRSIKLSGKLKMKGLYLLLNDKLEVQKEDEKKKSELPKNEEKFVDILVKNNHKLLFGSGAIKYNKPTLEKLARENGIKEQNLAKELAELSIFKTGREIARQVHNYTTEAKYRDIVKLYESQVNLSHRTSESIMFQQYSTPAPIGFVAGVYCGINENSGGEYFEASAGNGLLTIAGNPKNWIVNEIDNIRNRNLNSIGFKEVLKQDATEPFKNFVKKFDAIITNPPFARIDAVEYGNIKLTSLEQLMSLRALETMKDDGKGAIIIGGHTEYDKEGRIQAGKNRIFFVYLYKHYNVEDVINISGRDLYSRQGTSFNTRLILINGRKKVPSGFPPIITKPIPMDKTNSYTPVNSFEVLWERVNKLL